jgi:hypothetical protein
MRISMTNDQKFVVNDILAAALRADAHIFNPVRSDAALSPTDGVLFARSLDPDHIHLGLAHISPLF